MDNETVAERKMPSTIVTDIKGVTSGSTIVDDLVDAAVDQAAMMQERDMAIALWKLMNSRKGRRRPHRSFALREVPETAVKLADKRRRLKKLARRARAVTYKNR